MIFNRQAHDFSVVVCRRIVVRESQSSNTRLSVVVYRRIVVRESQSSNTRLSIVVYRRIVVRESQSSNTRLSVVVYRRIVVRESQSPNTRLSAMVCRRIVVPELQSENTRLSAVVCRRIVVRGPQSSNTRLSVVVHGRIVVRESRPRSEQIRHATVLQRLMSEQIRAFVERFIAAAVVTAERFVHSRSRSPPRLPRVGVAWHNVTPVDGRVEVVRVTSDVTNKRVVQLLSTQHTIVLKYSDTSSRPHYKHLNRDVTCVRWYSVVDYLDLK